KRLADENGASGPVLLEKGTYMLAGPLTISVGGVVLRGEGDGDDGTVLRAVMHKKAVLISIHGGGERREENPTRRKIVDERVPVGGKTITIDSESPENNAPHPALSRSTGRGEEGSASRSTGRGEEGGLKVGDAVMVVRNTNARWLHEIGMDR